MQLDMFYIHTWSYVHTCGAHEEEGCMVKVMSERTGLMYAVIEGWEQLGRMDIEGWMTYVWIVEVRLGGNVLDIIHSKLVFGMFQLNGWGQCAHRSSNCLPKQIGLVFN